MFKKILFVVFAAMLFSFCLAEDIVIEEPKSFAVNTESSDKIRDLVTDGMKDNGLGYFTEDIVTINEDTSLTVVTDGVSINVLPPFGSIAVTQDLIAQIDTYAMFGNPILLQQMLVADGTHIYILDLAFDTSIEVHTSEDVVSALIGDTNVMDSLLLDIWIEPIQEANPSIDVSIRTCGDNNFIVYDMRKSGLELIVYTCVKNGTNIDFYLMPGGSIITEDEIINMEYMLADVVLTAA